MELLKSSAAPRRAKPGTNGRTEITLKRALRTSRRTFGTQHVHVAMALLQLGDFLSYDQRYEEASAAFRQAASIYQQLGIGHELLEAIALRSLAQCLFTLESYREATMVNAQATELIVTYQ